MEIHTQSHDEIPVHILNVVPIEYALAEEKLAANNTVKRSTRKKGTSYNVGLTITNDSRSHQPVEGNEETDSKILANYHTQPTNEDQENVDHKGQTLYSFRTHTKSTNRMLKKAMIVEPPKPAKKKCNAEEREQKRTDFSKKRKLDKQIDLLRDDKGSSEEGSSSDESEEETKKPMFNDVDGYEQYFQGSRSKAKTSNNTLSTLDAIEPQEFYELLKQSPAKHKDEIDTLIAMHKQHFPQWYFELHSGFNLLFYGYGSKRNLLNEFAQSTLVNGPLIIVNGFFPPLSIKDILLKITAGALEVAAPTGQIQDHVSYICNYFSRDDREYESLYLVIHNVDGPNLRNERTQNILCSLASAPNIHLVASVDNINAAYLFNNVTATRYNWIWHDVTTFENYLVETSYENTLLMKSGEFGTSRGIQYVLASLTSNARGVFKILAEHQLAEMELNNMEGKGNESVGLSYNQYYQQCRQGFFVSSDLALRSELTEFKDHKIISIKKTVDGTEIFFIPLDKNTLLNIIETMA
ncbi:origin recognition complex subunit 2-domain-containing protein [Pilobolus umbonatus]|nr:origin recognition complex subunit 2-domain-containing protein [Pilobolus umbonatus]